MEKSIGAFWLGDRPVGLVSGRGERRVGEPGLQPSRVCGSTGQLRLDYSHGVLTIDEPADMALDGKPPATSGRMRLQAMSEERAERIDGGGRFGPLATDERKSAGSVIQANAAPGASFHVQRPR